MGVICTNLAFTNWGTTLHQAATSPQIHHVLGCFNPSPRPLSTSRNLGPRFSDVVGPPQQLHHAHAEPPRPVRVVDGLVDMGRFYGPTITWRIM